MSKTGKVVVGSMVVGAVALGLFLWSRNASAKQEGLKLVEVTRGAIVDKALAVGQIVPDQEIQVKSQISGIVSKAFVEVGDHVQVGTPLFAITPDPTPLELADAGRAVELAQVAFDRAEQNLDRQKSLWTGGIIAKDQFDSGQKDCDSARISLAQAKDKLKLLKEGRIDRANGQPAVDSIIRASVAGTVLERKVNEGDPVVPLTTYQEGTALMSVADMSTLLFRGTVDEIDVGKLKVGMPVRIQIGALPGAEVPAVLTKIAPKATEKEGATVFDVEASIDTTKSDIVLRAGYSANANVIIQEKKDVLLVPERLVTLADDKATVEVPAPKPGQEPVKKEIQVGLSDGLNMEVVAGLAEGEKVVQRPPKEIE
jgi:HlyD family secretion protein